MLLKHLIISCLVVISPVFPPAIIPITYTLMGIRLLQGAGPIAMSFGTVVPAALSSILIRLLYGYMHKKILAFKHKNGHQDWISRLENRFAKYLENRKRLSKLNKKITNYLETRNSKRVLFLLTIVAIDSAIPDIVAIGIVRKKLPFPLFILAAIIGKCTVYLPVIRLGK
jgi:membrane protein YqaA with SNARE-associated domain